MNDTSLRITEIFCSLQGEAESAGYPTVFVRLTGCPLRCRYCDSEYAFHGGERKELNDILNEVRSHGAQYVCVTGGEPLAQPGSIELMTLLCDEGFRVSIETSGALDIAAIDKRVSVVMDLKTPDSGELDKNLWSNVAHLDPSKDQLKFVVSSKSDFEWAAFKISELSLIDKVSSVFISPDFDNVDPVELANWVIESKLAVRMQIQLHKYLWGDKPGV